MATARFAWGIDVGNRALKAIKLVREGDALRIDDFEVIEHENVLSQSGDNRESLVQTAIANFVQRHQTKGGAVAIGVSGQSSFARFIKLPPVEKSKIPEIVRFEAIQQIPFPLDDVEWSYQLFQDEQSPDVEVGIFAMRKDLVNRQISYFKDVGLDVQVVQMNPLAVYNAVYYDQRITGTTMVVDLGAENTDLIIAEGETVWLRSIPIGGNNFTEALVKQFKLSFEKAEDLKRNAATSKYAKQIFQAMRPIFAELVAEIQRSIGFYASVHRDSRIAKVIALGGTFRLPGLQKYLQQNLQLPVERLDSVGAIMPTDAKLATTLNENILSTIGAYGLALQAMDQAKITSSLLPAAIRREKMWREKNKWFVGAAALFVLGTVGVNLGSYYLNSVSYDGQNSIRQEIGEIERAAQTNASTWQGQVENAGADARTRLGNVRSLLPGRLLWPKILSDLYAAQPTEPANQTPEQLKATPRGDRPFLYLNGFASHYVPNMDTILKLSNDEFRQRASNIDSKLPRTINYENGGGSSPFGGMNEDGTMPSGESTPADAAATPTAARGFLITIRCTTPNSQGARFVQERFLSPMLSALAQNNVKPDRPYYVARASIVRAPQLKDLGLPTPAAVAPTPDGKPPVNPMEDPRTKENMANDTEATLLLAIVINPPPPPKTAVAGQ